MDERQLTYIFNTMKSAYRVMDYVAGDTWEREITAIDRTRFGIGMYTFIAENKEKLIEMKLITGDEQWNL